jgi:hypothetical protein
MSNENLIHVKLEYTEALQSKRGLLTTQRDILRIAKIIKQYRALRLTELKAKQKALTKIKGLNTNIKKLQKTLPKIQMPEILQEHEVLDTDTEVDKEIKHAKNKEYDVSIENQLAEIQNKLKSLE